MLGLLRERACTAEGAEEVRAAVVREPPRGMLGVDEHSAHGVDRQTGIGGVSKTQRRKDFDGLGDVFQGLPTA